MEDEVTLRDRERASIMAAARDVLSRSEVQVNRRQLARCAGVAVSVLQEHFKSLLDLQIELTKSVICWSMTGAFSDLDRS